MLSLYKRGRIWQLRGVIDSKLVRWSLGTRDKEAASKLLVRIERSKAEGPESLTASELRAVLPPGTFAELAHLFGWHDHSETWAQLQRLFEEDMRRRLQFNTKRKLSPETVARYEQALKQFSAFLERKIVLLRRITTSMVEEYKAWRRSAILKHKAARGATSVALDLAIIHRTLEFARTAKMVHENLVLFEGTPGAASDDRGAQPFSTEELIKIRQASAGDNFLIFTLLRNTGLRRSDAVRLTWAEVDFDAQVIRRRTQKRGKTVEIPILPELSAALEFELDPRKPAPTDMVLLNPATGRPLTPRKLTARIRAIGKRAGIERAKP